MSKFEEVFFENYLKFGLGSMPKSDVDALVMYIVDEYGYLASEPLKHLSNQAVSERLKTPITKIKKLRYDAALKFGGDVEKNAKLKLLVSLSKATFDLDDEKICLIIEDSLAKNWLQGQLKNHQHYFDNSFNSEIIKISALGLIDVLEKVFQGQNISSFKSKYKSAKETQSSDERKQALKDFTIDLAKSIASGLGESFLAQLRSFIS